MKVNDENRVFFQFRQGTSFFKTKRGGENGTNFYREDTNFLKKIKRGG